MVFRGNLLDKLKLYEFIFFILLLLSLLNFLLLLEVAMVVNLGDSHWMVWSIRLTIASLYLQMLMDLMLIYIVNFVELKLNVKEQFLFDLVQWVLYFFFNLNLVFVIFWFVLFLKFNPIIVGFSSFLFVLTLVLFIFFILTCVGTYFLKWLEDNYIKLSLRLGFFQVFMNGGLLYSGFVYILFVFYFLLFILLFILQVYWILKGDMAMCTLDIMLTGTFLDKFKVLSENAKFFLVWLFK